MEESIELLDKITPLKNKYKKQEKENQSSGKCFNIFEIAKISENEVIMCKVLGELLNPLGSHYLKRLYLDLFLKNVIKLNSNINSPMVNLEEVIKDTRRIDIVITGKNDNNDNIYIPIEVKINATDQKNQLNDYAKYGENAPKKIYYLTKFGTEPLPYTRGNLKKSEIGCISWKDDILKWLDECLDLNETQERNSIKEILIQFKLAIEILTEKRRTEQMEIKKMLKESKEYLENAEKISEALTKAKKDLWTTFRDKLKAYNPSYADDWSICYDLKTIENNRKSVICINSDNKKEIHCYLQVRDNLNKLKETTKEFLPAKKFNELANNMDEIVKVYADKIIELTSDQK